MTIRACFADSLEPMGGPGAIKGALPEGFGGMFLWATRGRSRERAN